MENFFSYISRPVDKVEVETWIATNNICFMKMELFHDFVIGIIGLIYETYLGNEDGVQININPEDDEKHFDWCWSKTIDAFSKENINFELNGDHKDYFSNLLMDLFYNTENRIISDNIEPFFVNLFDDKVGYSQSDLEMITEIYKLLNKNIIRVN